MSTPQQLNDTTIKTTSKLIWLGIQASVPLFVVAILMLDKVMRFDPIMPEFKNIFIGLCVLGIPVPFFVFNLFKRKQLEIRNNIQSGMGNESKDLLRYMSLLIIGMSLCNLTAALGLILYIISGDAELAVFFITLSLLLGFLFKPSLK